MNDKIVLVNDEIVLVNNDLSAFPAVVIIF